MPGPILRNLFRPRQAQPTQRPAAAAYPPPRRPLPPLALLLSQYAQPQAARPSAPTTPAPSDEDEDDTNDLSGAYTMAAYPFPRRPACRLVRRGGQTIAVDEMGNEAVVMADDFGADDFGADDDMGEDEDDDFGADDEFGADEFGADESTLRARLAKLTYKYNTASGLFAKARKKSLAKRIAKIKIALAKMGAQNKASAAQLAAAMGAGAAMGAPLSRTSSTQVAAGVSPREAAAVRASQARNGLIYNVVAPPGSGRLVRLPFYASGVTIPRTSFTLAAPGTAASVTLTTEDVSYATVRVVGFVAQVTVSLSTGSPSGLSQGFVEDLKVGGGANLFLHEQAADASQYDTDVEHLLGLRGYPILRSPNRCTVSAFAQIGNANDVVVVSCALVCDVLTDDVFGAGISGPYAG